jgi:hypothetical protein
MLVPVAMLVRVRVRVRVEAQVPVVLISQRKISRRHHSPRTARCSIEKDTTRA